MAAARKPNDTPRRAGESAPTRNRLEAVDSAKDRRDASGEISVSGSQGTGEDTKEVDEGHVELAEIARVLLPQEVDPDDGVCGGKGIRGRTIEKMEGQTDG